MILELDSIRNLVTNNFIVVACGGGGIPITEGKKSKFVEAVIDKDLTSEILASGIGESLFVNLTNVEGSFANFGENQKIIKKISIDKLKDLSNQGCFEEVTMEPKINAAINLLKKRETEQ